MIASNNVASKRSSKRPLKVGLLLPHWIGSFGGKTPGGADILALAHQAESVGFDSLWTVDELLMSFKTGDRIDVWECWSLLSALATCTSQVILGSLVSCVGYRNPALLAKIADTVDEISRGRLVLGLGAGSNPDTHEFYGFPWKQPYSRFEEALTIIQRLFQREALDFAGEHYQLNNCELLLRGPHPAGPPLLIGTMPQPGPRLLRLTAQFAQIWNGWLAFEPCSPLDLLPALNEKLDAACEKVQRDPATLERTIGVGVALLGQSLTAGPQEVIRGALTGESEQIADSLRALTRYGISHVQIYLAPCTPAGVEAFAPVLACLDE